MPVGAVINVCQTVLLFDDLSVHPFVCNYTALCMFLSVCLSTSSSIVCLYVRPCVRPSAYMHIFSDIVCNSIGLDVFFPFIRPSVLSSSIGMNACLFVCCLCTCP